MRKRVGLELEKKNDGIQTKIKFSRSENYPKNVILRTDKLNRGIIACGESTCYSSSKERRFTDLIFPISEIINSRQSHNSRTEFQTIY